MTWYLLRPVENGPQGPKKPMGPPSTITGFFVLLLNLVHCGAVAQSRTSVYSTLILVMTGQMV